MQVSAKTEYYGIACVIFSGVLYGAIGFFGVRLLQSDLTINDMLFWRFLIAALTVIPLLILQRSNLLNKSYMVLAKSFLLGALLYSLPSYLYFLSSEYIGTGLAMVLFFTYPVFVAILSWGIDGTKISKFDYLAFILLVIGFICLIDLNDLEFDLLGMALALLSALLYAPYVVISKKLNNELTEVESTLMITLGSTVAFFVIAYLNSELTISDSVTIWVYILGFAVICTSLPILFMLKGMKYISATKASIFSLFEPVFVVLIGVLVLGESITFFKIIGICLILSSAVAIQLNKKSTT